MKHTFLFFCFVCIFFTVNAQSRLQDSVHNLYIDFVYAKTEFQKNEKGKMFSDALKYALISDTKGEFRFDSLKAYKVMLESADKQVRIFTWGIESDDRTHTYYGFVHAYNHKSKSFEVYELKDKSRGMRDPENATLDNMKWLGAYYYHISEYKYKKKKYYLLLGWSGNNGITNKRIIELLQFSEKGFPKFGEPVFVKENGKTVRRVIFEFKAGIVMSVKYHPDKSAIIFDHLSPSHPHLEGQYEFYGPDFTYDMFELKNGKWKYVKEVDARNPKNKTDKHFQTPK